MKERCSMILSKQNLLYVISQRKITFDGDHMDILQRQLAHSDKCDDIPCEHLQSTFCGPMKIITSGQYDFIQVTNRTISTKYYSDQHPKSVNYPVFIADLDLKLGSD